MQKAVFLDRDGVINIDKNYLYKIEDFEFIDGVFESLSYLQSQGYLLFIITNQSGIGRAYYSKEDFETLTVWMNNKFKENGIMISQVEYCPHHPNDDCNCRKPKIGMIENILKNHEVDLEKSWLIGDKESDILCAKNAEIANSIQVKTSYKFEDFESKANYVCNSIADIINIIKT